MCEARWEEFTYEARLWQRRRRRGTGADAAQKVEMKRKKLSVILCMTRRGQNIVKRFRDSLVNQAMKFEMELD